MVWVLFLLGAGLLWLGLHPFTTYPLSLLLVRVCRRTPPDRPGDNLPERFALCFCAYNEERVIGEKIANCLALRQTHPELQILAYVDAATDRTVELMRRHEHEITLRVSPRRQGKTHGMNRLPRFPGAARPGFHHAKVRA